MWPREKCGREMSDVRRLRWEASDEIDDDALSRVACRMLHVACRMSHVAWHDMVWHDVICKV